MKNLRNIHSNTVVVLDGLTFFSLNMPIIEKIRDYDSKQKEIGSRSTNYNKLIYWINWSSVIRAKLFGIFALVGGNPVRSTPPTDNQPGLQTVHWAYWT